jgi:conjugative transposon TraM protein
MKINFKQPKYVLPLLALPFLCLFYYAWQSSFSKNKPAVKQPAGLNGMVGDVSSHVRKQELTGKLDAYRNAYKDADGLSAVKVLPTEGSASPVLPDTNNSREKKTLDSIDRAIKQKFSRPAKKKDDQTLAGAINSMAHRQRKPEPEVHKENDPMDLFRQQMSYIDSIGKQNDPAFKAAKLKQEAARKAALTKANEKHLSVVKAGSNSDEFNTVKPTSNDNFIMATIDENMTGYAGSRLRLRLLEDIKAGNNPIPKGTYIYALISGFNGQRVTLAISSILSGGKILPVKLDVYDLDGMAGLYVPSSAFRDFTKDLSGNTMQGVSIDNGTGGSQFIMSSVDKIFQSTSSAIAGLIRKNKAKMKYNSYIYLIDNDALQNASAR